MSAVLRFRWAVGSVAALAFFGALDVARAQPAPPPGTDESQLGVVEVTGAAAVPLPKLAVVPLAGDANDTNARAVVSRDLDLIGAFDVVTDGNMMPPGPWEKDDPIDAKAWRAKGFAMLVRTKPGSANGKATIHAEAWLLAKGNDPVFQADVPLEGDVRHAAHETADEIVGALTGRKGPFASRLAWVARVGKGRQVFVGDIDAQSKTAYGDAADTALSPTFGPNGDVWFTVSKNFTPFQLAHGKDATPVKVGIKGSVLSVAFSPDKSKIGLGIMSEDVSKVYTGKADLSDLTPIKAGKLANRPVFGPLGKMAWVANDVTQRIFVDGTIVSPSGFHASAPTFCDSPQGLLVVFTVGVGNGADLIATDTSGGSMRRLTQGFGANAYPACSPDGRLVAFFSTGAGGKAPGTYVLPLTNPTRIRKLSDEKGESLAWAR